MDHEIPPGPPTHHPCPPPQSPGLMGGTLALLGGKAKTAPVMVAWMVRNLPAVRRPGFDPWVGKNPCRRQRQPTPVISPGESHGQRGLEGYSLWSPAVRHDCLSIQMDGHRGSGGLKARDTGLWGPSGGAGPLASLPSTPTSHHLVSVTRFLFKSTWCSHPGSPLRNSYLSTGGQ